MSRSDVVENQLLCCRSKSLRGLVTQFSSFVVDVNLNPAVRGLVNIIVVIAFCFDVFVIIILGFMAINITVIIDTYHPPSLCFKRNPPT